ncbi:zinc finger CCCH domain-containing protein 27 isoform X2 [Cryptomeria japonica]|uniref:zinc finger CCCH domain-containing protein 27 isoform X2 n=1 Tax=Cryptomeria japonica TaxID=3369 RepID=UPI0027DAAC53|nr:zinc finger CCCH domain-containing protein 27 isoform X2 [Cryptomeria japonica]
MAKNNVAERRTPATTKMKFQEPLLVRYLVKNLKPLSEADPALVANYIVALLKNNKPQEELQKICIEQLHEFLGDNTMTFVTQLFNALEDGRTFTCEDDTESRKFVDAPTTVAHADSTEISSSLQNEKLPSAVVGAFAEHEEQEGSNDEDDDRNHKHTRRAIDSPSLNWDIQDEDEKSIRKRNRPVSNAEFVPESDTETSKPSRESIPLRTDVEVSAKYFKKRHGSALSFPSRLNVDGDHRRGNQGLYDQAVGPGFDSLNGCVRLASGRARGINTGQWAPPDSRFPSYESVDFPSAIPPFRPAAATLYTRPILNHGNPTNTPWVAFGSMSGMPNGGLKQPHLFNTGLQGGRGLSLSSTLRVGVGMGRPRCRDFEERGFCLRGDMCPMEHGANRIVVDDVQSLSQYNLSVPVPARQLVGKGTGLSNGPSTDLTRNISREKSIGYGPNRDSEHLNASSTSAAGIEADLYDPDQPLLNNAHPGSARGLKSHKKGDEEHLWDGNAPDGLGDDILNVDDNIRTQRGGSSIGLSHNSFPSVWDRIGPVDYACNKREEGSRVADVFDGSQQHGKQSKKELYGNQEFHSHSEDREKESDSDHDSGSKDVNIQMRNGKVRSTSKLQVPKESVNDSQKIAETSTDATHRNAVHRSGRRGSEKAQRTLYVSCIPPKSNKVESLLLHFRKFGEVLGVRVPPNSDKAFVQYSCREEAEAALASPDAVMGNRFIRLAWAHWDSSTKHEKISAPAVPSGTSSGAMSVALTYPQPPKQKNSNSISFSLGPSTSEVSHSADNNSAKSATVKDLSSTISATHKQETLETLKLIREKQEILAQKREDFRRRLDKLAKQGIDSRGDSSDKNRTVKRQKTEDLVTCSNNSHSSASLGAVSGQAFMTKKEQGEPACSPYQFKIDDWSTSLRILPPIPHGLMDIIGLKEHFSSFGDLSSVELEDLQSGCDGASKIPETCSVLVTYDTRHAAERAFIEGNCWQGKKLQLAWVLTPDTTNRVSVKNHLPSNLKCDSRRGPLTAKETSGGKTVTMNDTTSTDKSIEEYFLE